jgi:hypothetical protein
MRLRLPGEVRSPRALRFKDQEPTLSLFVYGKSGNMSDALRQQALEDCCTVKSQYRGVIKSSSSSGDTMSPSSKFGL